jgi:PAS domain S-box-containing protein
VRISELIAYPLFAIAIYHGAVQSLSRRSTQLHHLSQISLDQVKGLISLYTATRTISSPLDVASVLDSAAKSIAEALEADQCAIALPENEKDMSRLRLVAIHNPSRQGRGESVVFPIKDQQAINHALKRKYQVIIDEYKDNAQIRMLFTLMGAPDVGPLLIQPLLKEEEPFGLMILGNAISKRDFSATEAELAKSLAAQTAIAIQHAQEYALITSKSQHLSWTLRNQELDSGKRLAAMESELKKSREEVSLFSQRLHGYETEQGELQSQLHLYRDKAAKLETTMQQARQKVEDARKKEQQRLALQDEVEKARQQLAELETERKSLLDKVENLESDEQELHRLAVALAASNERGRKLARALKKAREHGQQITPIPAPMASAEANAQLEDLSCGVIITDGQEKISRVNEVACAMLGRSGKHLLGSRLPEVIADERWQKVLEQFRLSNDPTTTTTLMIGDQILRATISPMGAKNSKEGTVTILYDVTTEAESQQARDEFIASLSQELRTPMTSITGYTDLLVGESVGMIGEMQRKFLQRIKANIERMNAMLNDLIGVTAIDAGQLELRPTSGNMVEAIEDTIIGARAQLEENQITLNPHITDEVPPVEADPDSVRQILSNLLGNAIKSTPNGGSIDITTTIFEENGATSGAEDFILPYVKVSVKDSGGGISEKDLNRVFERFYRAERPLIEGLGETGVGLSIVKSLVEAHGGGFG